MQIDGLTVASIVARDPALMRGVEVVLTTSNSSTFKHSDVRKLRSAFKRAVNLIVVMEHMEDRRSTFEEF